MCGISGIYNLNGVPVDETDLKRFNDSMTHRGPDDYGMSFLDKHCLGLAQRRLSILDLSALGHQPMSYGEERFSITYNGEIFNFAEIKDSLETKGHVFNTRTDTEVILAAYMEWGPMCLKKFNGMWAFAIWDNLNKELFLARDRFGIKPLYYHHDDGKRFVFASETRAFKFLNGFNRQIDDIKLHHNLIDPYALEGLGHTIYKGIFQLLPGHFMIVKKNEMISQRRWWSIEDCHPDVPSTFEEQTQKFHELFKDACRIRLVSDVPLATALSGGLDSTAVYSTVYDILKTENLGRVNKDAQRAFTATFKGLPNDEREYAQMAANFTGGPIEFLESNDYQLAERVQRETELCDFINVSPISAISSVYEGMRKNGITVSLDGHGVDEMLYGYRDMVYGLYNEALWNGKQDSAESYRNVLSEMYYSDYRMDFVRKSEKHLEEKRLRESSVKHKFKKIIGKSPESKEYLPVTLPQLSDKPYDFQSKPLPERMAYYEFFQHTLPALLRNFDRAGMINSIEIRMPFMDWRLVSYVFSLPIESKIGQGFTKRILREAMKGHMDESLRTRTFKVGIGSPIEHWMNGALKDWTMDTLKDKNLRDKLEHEYKTGQASNQLVKDVWQSINLDLITR